MSIAEMLQEIAAQRFVGRRDELAQIAGLSDRAAGGACVAYVFGPPGCGKSALLRAAERLAARRGTLVLSARAGDGSGASGVLEQLAAALGSGDPSAQGISTAIARHGQSGVFIALDDYDRLGGDEADLRRDLLYPLPAGCAVVLAGRAAPAALWPVDGAWRSFVERLPLGDLALADARRVLAAHGVEDPLVQATAHRLTGGRPALLAQVADVVAGEGETAAAADVVIPSERAHADIESHVVEQILHPGSRRTAWRPADAKDPGDLVLQAASLLPYFRPYVIAAMLGDAVATTGLELLGRLPTVREGGGWLRLHEGLRRPVASRVVGERPWLSRVWWGRAVRRLLADGARRGPREEALALHLLLMPGPGQAAAPAAALITGESAVLAARGVTVEPWLHRVAWPASGRVCAVQGENGAPLGVAGTAPADALPQEALPGGMRFAGRSVLVLAAEQSWAVGPLAAALAGAARLEPKPYVLALGAARAAVVRLGLRPVGGSVFAFEESPAQHDWLAAAAERWFRPSEAHVGELGKEALQKLASGQSLAQTRAAEVYRGMGGDASDAGVRRWLLDALRSADLGDGPCCRREILRLYYVERIGSHEDIADRLDLPRASYFRAHREAIAAFGAALTSLG